MQLATLAGAAAGSSHGSPSPTLSEVVAYAAAGQLSPTASAPQAQGGGSPDGANLCLTQPGSPGVSLYPTQFITPAAAAALAGGTAMPRDDGSDLSEGVQRSRSPRTTI